MPQRRQPVRRTSPAFYSACSALARKRNKRLTLSLQQHRVLQQLTCLGAVSLESPASGPKWYESKSELRRKHQGANCDFGDVFVQAATRHGYSENICPSMWRRLLWRFQKKKNNRSYKEPQKAGGRCSMALGTLGSSLFGNRKRTCTILAGQTPRMWLAILTS